MTQQITKQPETLVNAMALNGLMVRSEFVPLSQSRNRENKDPSLNWRVTLLKNGREVLTTDYSAGCGHAPSYKQADRTIFAQQLIAWECENGKRGVRFGEHRISGTGKTLEPNATDVMSSLLLDSDVLDCATYESWAREFGYDEDSRKGEATYRACLEIALKLRSGLGESVLADLRAAAVDY